jgi:hypothetical protein
MATFTWTLQGTSPTTIDATDIIQFAGATFDSAITVGSYNDSTHVESSVGANDSSGNSPHNTKYLTSSTLSLDGGASSAVSALTTANCPLKINFSDASSVTTTSGKFYAYDGTTTTNAPVGVTFQAFEQGDSAWTNAEGSANAVTINDDTAATSHDYFFGISASPESVGEKTSFKLRIELTYA